jgi:predicted metal-dependent hydrolase
MNGNLLDEDIAQVAIQVEEYLEAPKVTDWIHFRDVQNRMMSALDERFYEAERAFGLKLLGNDLDAAEQGFGCYTERNSHCGDCQRFFRLISMELHQVHFGERIIEYTLTYSPRKMLAISVHPDLHVTVEAPESANFEAVQTKVKKRAAWILKQQCDLTKYHPHQPPIQYLSGETHRYLGKQYRHKVLQADVERVKLEAGYLYIYTIDPRQANRVNELLDAWYLQQTKSIFRQRLNEILHRFAHLNIPEPILWIRSLTARWDSCTPSGKIILNVKLIQVPKAYIDYLIIHELCHLKEHNQSKRLYMLLNAMLSDWRERKENLNGFEFG